MSKYHPVAVRFVDEYLSREIEYIDFIEFSEEGWTSDISIGELYIEVTEIISAIRDRLDLITEN